MSEWTPERIAELRDAWSAWKDNNSVLAALDEIERLQARVVELIGVIERDRSKAADILTGIRRAMQRHSWLREGRGSYEWDDDRWRDEFGDCLDAIDEALKPLSKLAADLSNSPESLEARRIARGARDQRREQLLREFCEIMDGEKSEWGGRNPWTLLYDLEAKIRAELGDAE